MGNNGYVSEIFYGHGFKESRDYKLLYKIFYQFFIIG